RQRQRPDQVGDRRLRLLRLQRPEPARRPRHHLGLEQDHDVLVKRHSGQALVEFALVAPVLLLIIGATVDMGRGLLLYSLLSGASRDTARQAALTYYSRSNPLPPNCTALTTPCSLNPLMNGAHLLDPLGVQVVYQDSPSIIAAAVSVAHYWLIPLPA